MNSHCKLCRSYNTPGEAHELTFSCFRQLSLLSKDKRVFAILLDLTNQELAGIMDLPSGIEAH